MNRPGSIKADVQTRQGVLVRHLINQEAQAGVVTVTWDGRNENNSVVAAGVYSIALQAAGKKSFHKVILLK
jgi:flagellar hook assembly protein FlgD